jgi:hypothetical protein
MRHRLGLLAVLVAAAFPASAAAAPDKTAELSADTPAFAWTGEGTGLPLHASGDVNFLLELAGQKPFACDTEFHDCDYILLDVKHPGKVKITAAADDSETHEIPAYGNLTVPDIDLYFYASDKDGVPQGDSLTEANCATGEGVETCESPDLRAGLYVVEVSFFLADEATYKADVALKTDVPPTPAASDTPAEAPPAPAPSEPQQAPSQQAPPAAPPQSADEPKPAAKKPSKRAACKKKAKKIKNKSKRRKALKRCAKKR